MGATATRTKHLGHASAHRAPGARASADGHARGAARADRDARGSDGGDAMKFSESPILALRLPVWRARLMLIGFIGAFLLLLGRAAYLQAMNEDFLQAKGESRYSRVLEVPATRGKILDRNGDALAISTPVKSIWAIPEDVEASRSELTQLAK